MLVDIKSVTRVVIDKIHDFLRVDQMAAGKKIRWGAGEDPERLDGRGVVVGKRKANGHLRGWFQVVGRCALT